MRRTVRYVGVLTYLLTNTHSQRVLTSRLTRRPSLGARSSEGQGGPLGKPTYHTPTRPVPAGTSNAHSQFLHESGFLRAAPRWDRFIVLGPWGVVFMKCLSPDDDPPCGTRSRTLKPYNSHSEPYFKAVLAHVLYLKPYDDSHSEAL